MGFDKQQLDQMTVLASKGFSMRQTADYLGLTYLEFFRLVKQYPEVVSSYRKERIDTTLKVVQVLNEKAIGIFEQDE